MTEGEAKVVAALMASADGWCGNCGRELFGQAKEIWPEFPWDEWWPSAMDSYDNDSEFSLWDNYECDELNQTKLRALLGEGE